MGIFFTWKTGFKRFFYAYVHTVHRTREID